MQLTPRSERREVLLAAGVPEVFLAALAGLAHRDDHLDCLFCGEDSAYGYLAEGREVDFPDLAGLTITPVYSGTNGDTFLLYCVGDDGRRLIDYGLEEGTLDDYGINFQMALADLVIQLYEFEDEWPPERIAKVAAELGFVRPDRLIEELEKPSRQGSESDQEWRARVLPGIVN